MRRWLRRRASYRWLCLCIFAAVELWITSLSMSHLSESGAWRTRSRADAVKHQHAIFDQWRAAAGSRCRGRFVGYASEFALLRGVIIDRRRWISKNEGGEDLRSVINQTEEEEYFRCRSGAFRLRCNAKPSYHFNEGTHLRAWMASVNSSGLRNGGNAHVADTQLTIAVQRYEYVNLYHTMTDWYNAFLMKHFFFDVDPDPDVLFVDAHPRGDLDQTWSVLFRSARQLRSLPVRVQFPSLVWSILGYHSPLSEFFAAELPLVEEFRSFFLSSFNMDDNHSLNCNRLNILFIWRRDYVTHPRNPSGRISRKFGNEAEILRHVQKTYPSHKVRGVQVDRLSMKGQLMLMSSTDILIGVHGAGLTHGLFLPPKAAIIELFPAETSLDHFRSIARWRHLLYASWTDSEGQYMADDGYSLSVPPRVISLLINDAVRQMCASTITA